MKKIKLDLDRLQVESFTASPEAPARGTVVANATEGFYQSQCCATQYQECTYDAACQSEGACGDDPIHTGTCQSADCVTDLCGDM